jgi:hypothetical protein
MKRKDKIQFDWNQISISKYYEIKDIVEDKDTDDISKNVQLVALMLDKDEQEVWDMELTEVGEYIKALSFLDKFEIPKNPAMNITLPGYKIRVMKDITKINMAQYVDYQNFMRMPLRESMDKILSIFLIPEGKTYNTDYDIIDLQKTIRENLSFRVAEGLLGFFLRRWGESLVRSLDYYRKTAKKEKDPQKKKEMEEMLDQIKKKIKDLTSLAGLG